MRERDFTIRRLSEEDVEAFRAIRLEALEQSPEAFGSTLEKELSYPIERFTERFKQNTLFGGFIEGVLVGIVGFSGPLDGPKVTHKSWLWGMYVRPEARGSGLAAGMVEYLIKCARGQVEQIHLAVIGSNPRAQKFYQRMGFSQYGLEKKAFKYNGAYCDKILMVMFL